MKTTKLSIFSILILFPLFICQASIVEDYCTNKGKTSEILFGDFKVWISSTPLPDLFITNIQTNETKLLGKQELEHKEGYSTNINYGCLEQNESKILVEAFFEDSEIMHFCTYDINNINDYFCSFENKNYDNDNGYGYRNIKWQEDKVYFEKPLNGGVYDDYYTHVFPDADIYNADWNGENMKQVGTIVDGKEIREDNTTELPTYITQAQSRGYLQGYPDGTLKLENPVNRAEFAKMLMMAFAKGDGNTENLKKFPDVQTTEWYAKPLAKAVELGIMQGYADGTMKPTNTINMVEAVKMALETKYPNEDFTPTVGEQWYAKYLSFTNTKFPNLSFTSQKPDHLMTRGECVELIEGVIED